MHILQEQTLSNPLDAGTCEVVFMVGHHESLAASGCKRSLHGP